MSLVAYGASDDSETSDVDEEETLHAADSGPSSNREVGLMDDGKISDEDDFMPTHPTVSTTSSSSSSSTSHIGIPKPTSSTTDTGIGLLSLSTLSTLNDLPAPKAASSAQSSDQGNDEDELEDEVKAKPSELADAPKPPPKKVKKPTRIMLPALTQDSDEEDDSKKKPKQSSSVSGSSGLFALLPPPMHGTKKQANRPLIPYTLTKRPTPSKTPSKPVSSSSTLTTKSVYTDPLPSQKRQSAFNAMTGYESDSDEDDSGPSAGGSNFFSIGSEADETTSSPSVSQDDRTSGESLNNSSNSVAIKSASSASESPVSSSSNVSAPTATESQRVGNVSSDFAKSEGEEEVSSSTVGIPQMNEDGPLTFTSSLHGPGWSSAPLTSPMLPEMYAASSRSGTENYWQRQEHHAQDYSNMEQEFGSSGGSSIQQYMEDEQFRRISGKRKRGEDIEIIDASVDDYVDPSDLMKGITEESSYQPHRKKDNMPSSQQKRKKQITYLAFQAKEKELELKNAWSQNRTTKNQARSKYGF